MREAKPVNWPHIHIHTTMVSVISRCRFQKTRATVGGEARSHARLRRPHEEGDRLAYGVAVSGGEAVRLEVVHNRVGVAIPHGAELLPARRWARG